MSALITRSKRFILSREWPPRSGASLDSVVRSAFSIVIAVAALGSGLARLDWRFIAVAVPIFGVGVAMWPPRKPHEPKATDEQDTSRRGA